MDEKYVINLLKDTLNDKQEELDRTTKSIDHIRNRIHISTDKKDYIWLKKDLDALEYDRRELRGKVSALRQAIKKLEREQKELKKNDSYRDYPLDSSHFVDSSNYGDNGGGF